MRHLERHVGERLRIAVEQIEVFDRQHQAKASAPKIGFDDARIARDFRGRALGDRRAVMQDMHARRERHDGAHHMLDHDDRDVLLGVQRAQDVDDAVRLGRTQAGHHFVEQQQLRSRRERARDFEPLAVGQGQFVRLARVLVPEIEPPQHLARARISCVHVGRAQHGADRGVFEHGEFGKRAHDLKRAREPKPADMFGRGVLDALAGKGDAARIRRKDAGDQIEQRRLAGAVRADDGEDRARLDIERNIVDRDKTAEALGHALELRAGSSRRAPQAQQAREPRP